mgnify:FL=1
MKKLMILGVLMLSGCGTVFCGQNQTVLIDSDPAGVKIYQNGRLLGETPLTTKLERTKNPLMLSAKKEGYNDQSIMLRSTLGMGAIFDGAFAILSITGTTGFSTDASNETIYAYSPDQIFVDMIKNGEEDTRDSKIKMFVTKNFDALHLEAANGGGMTVSALAQMSGKSEALLMPAIQISNYPSDLIRALLK